MILSSLSETVSSEKMLMDKISYRTVFRAPTKDLGIYYEYRCPICGGIALKTPFYNDRLENHTCECCGVDVNIYRDHIILEVIKEVKKE